MEFEREGIHGLQTAVLEWCWNGGQAWTSFLDMNLSPCHRFMSCIDRCMNLQPA